MTKRITALAMHYPPTSVGGAERSLHRNLIDLSKLGYDCKAVSYLDAMACPFRARNIIEDNGVKIFQEDYYGRKISVEFHILTSDIIFTMLTISPIIVEVAKRHNKKIVNFVCDEICYSNPFIKESIMKSDVVISNSEYTKNRLLEIGIESVVLFPSFNKFNGSNNYTREYILFVYPHKHKGHEIVKHLSNKFPEQKFIVVGDCKFDFMQNSPVAVYHSNNLYYVGSVEQEKIMDELYKKSILVLSPSQVKETFGMVAAEAIYRDIPVMASNIGALPETVGGAGIIIDDYSNLESWENELKKFLLENKEYNFSKQQERYKNYSNIEILDNILKGI